MPTIHLAIYQSICGAWIWERNPNFRFAGGALEGFVGWNTFHLHLCLPLNECGRPGSPPPLPATLVLYSTVEGLPVMLAEGGGMSTREDVLLHGSVAGLTFTSSLAGSKVEPVKYTSVWRH